MDAPNSPAASPTPALAPAPEPIPRPADSAGSIAVIIGNTTPVWPGSASVAATSTPISALRTAGGTTESGGKKPTDSGGAGSAGGGAGGGADGGSYTPLEAEWNAEIRTNMNWVQRCYFVDTSNRVDAMRRAAATANASASAPAAAPTGALNGDASGDGDGDEVSLNDFFAAAREDVSPAERIRIEAAAVYTPPIPAAPATAAAPASVELKSVNIKAVAVTPAPAPAPASTAVDPNDSHHPLNYVSLQLGLDPSTFRSFDFEPLSGDVIPHPNPPNISQWTVSLRTLAGLHFEEKSRLESYRFFRTVSQIHSMVLPVLFMVGLIVGFVHVFIRPQIDADHLLFRVLLIYKQPNGESNARVFGGSMINALMVIASITALTLIFVAIYVRNRRAVIINLLRGLIVTLIGVAYAYFIYQFSWLYDIPFDAFTLVVGWWNFTAVAACTLVYFPSLDTRHVYTYFHKAALLALAVALAWPFLEFPEWSVWATFISLGVYDLIAVLTPCGPLKYIINAEDGFSRDPLPGLMFKGRFFQLGLGDFVFYAALVGRAVIKASATDEPDAAGAVITVFACTLGILMGLAATILLTVFYQMPAIIEKEEPKAEAAAPSPAVEAAPEAVKSGQETKNEPAAAAGPMDQALAAFNSLPLKTRAIGGGFLFLWLLYGIIIAVIFVVAAVFGPDLFAQKFKESVLKSEAEAKNAPTIRPKSQNAAAPEAGATVPTPEAEPAAAGGDANKSD